MVSYSSTLSQTTSFRLFQTKSLQTTINRKFPKRVENTVGKGEIARYEQFLRFQQMCSKTFTADTKTKGLFGKELRFLSHPVSLITYEKIY